MDSTNPMYEDLTQSVSNPLDFKETSNLVPQDPITLDIPDDELEPILTARITASEKFYEDKYNLKARRRKNEKYLWGRQIQDKEKGYKDYEARSADNVLYEIEASLKPIAMSKLPDIIVTPGGGESEKIENAKNLTLVIDDETKKSESRTFIGLAFKHLPVYFTAVGMARWNPEKGKAGDYEFLNINPEYIIVDHTCTTRNPDDMGFIARLTPMSIQELVMKFPNKKQEIYDEAKITKPDPSWKDLATEIKPVEVWFDWYKRKGQDNERLVNTEEMKSASIMEPGVKWERISGVIWKFGHTILDKMLDPNFDHEGVEKIFSYGVPGDESTKQEVPEQDLMMSAMTGQEIPNLVKEKVYNNYFERPHKPFYFLGYDQWGKVYLDETSRIEQNIYNQENLDDQNKTMVDQLKARVKHIWSLESGLKKEDVQRLDMDDNKMDVAVKGDPNKVHKSIQPERPDQAQVQAVDNGRSRMYAKSGSTAIRGTVQSDTATSNQIAREADFTRSDDLVEETINGLSEWKAQWIMQFIKLRYTEDHLKEILGPKGDATYISLRRDTISNGMNTRIKSSSTDKIKAQRNAMDTAQLGPPYTNPLDFFRDMGSSDPEGRTERGLILAIDPNIYYQKFVMGLDTTQQAATALQAGGVPPQGPGAQPVPPNQVPGGQAPTQPAGPTPSNTSATPTAQPQFPTGSPRGL